MRTTARTIAHRACLSSCLAALACSPQAPPQAAADPPPGDDTPAGASYVPPIDATVTVTAPGQPATAVTDDPSSRDAGGGAPPTPGDDAAPLDAAGPTLADARPDGACAGALAPGDLIIDELMIESVSGSGDYGEWLEVTSTVGCAIDLKGLHGECPRGASVTTFDLSDDVWVPARGSFVVADSTDPAVNHYLPGTVVGWLGHPSDVLRNMGTTVTLTLAGVVIDTLTYPALALTAGTSLELPADCDPAQRLDFTLWKPSASSWFPGFHGTPNAPNADVSCSD